MNKKYNNKDLLEARGHDWKTNKIWKLSQEDKKTMQQMYIYIHHTWKKN